MTVGLSILNIRNYFELFWQDQQSYFFMVHLSTTLSKYYKKHSKYYKSKITILPSTGGVLNFNTGHHLEKCFYYYYYY